MESQVAGEPAAGSGESARPRLQEFHSPLAWVLTAIVLALSLGGTWLLWRGEKADTRRSADAAFDFRARAVATRIQNRMEAYTQILHGARGLFAASVSVERGEFHAYVESLQLFEAYRGIQGVGYSVIVPAEHLAEHLAAVRREGFPGYSIRPEGPRDPYTSIVYLEPFAGRNLRAFGYDMYSEPIRRAAMDRSRDEGGSAVSDMVKLVQETDEKVQAGFLVYVPVYRNGASVKTVEERRRAILGWVYAPFRVDDFLAGIVGERETEVAIALYDGETASAGTRMSSPDSADAAGADGGARTTTRRIEVSGHPWTLVVRARPLFERRVETGKASLIAVAGLGASLLLAALTWTLATGRARALRAAREVRESEKRYRQMFEENASAAYIVDPSDGRIADANASALRFWGYSREEVVGRNISAINTAPADELGALLERLRIGQTYRFDARHRLKSGEVRDVEIFSGPLSTGGRTLLYSLLHDVTERRRSESEVMAARAEVEEANEKLRAANRELAEMASHDTLTGAWNRRKFEAEVHLETERTRRSGRPLALVLFDLDHFKDVNDQLGHQAGDRILAGVSRLVRENIRGVDSITRWGGEEFIVVAPYSSGADATVLAEKLRAVVAEHDFGAGARVTISLGVAEYRTGESLDDWIGRGDAALYEAKAAGRNTVRPLPGPRPALPFTEE